MMPALEYLGLNENLGAGDSFCQALAETITTRGEEREPLKLKRLRLEKTGLTAVGSACLGRMLPMIPSLEWLLLENNVAAGDMFCQALADAIASYGHGLEPIKLAQLRLTGSLCHQRSKWPDAQAEETAHGFNWHYRRRTGGID